MSKHMLGRLPLSAVQGLRAELEERLAGEDGELWLAEGKKFLRKETCWLKLESRSDPSAPVKAILARDKWLERWQNFYRLVFGIKSSTLRAEFKKLRVPLRRAGFYRLVVVLKGLDCNQVFGICAKSFPSWRWTEDLNGAIVHNDREPTQNYAIWIRDRVEADEENKNLSADDLQSRDHLGMTLLERLLLELFYHWETGRHLDIENWTLCAGSRYSDGRVPFVLYASGDCRLCVDWTDRDRLLGHLRSRSVVSS